MVKTQIQLPDALYRRAKAFAKEREWSLAETFRRAAEEMFEKYPGEVICPAEDWSPPISENVGWRGLSAEELRDAARQDMEPVVK